MARRKYVRGRIREGRAILRGARATKTGPVKFVKMLVQGAFEQRTAWGDYKRSHGKAAYKAARKQDKASKRYYQSKWEY